MQAGRAQQVLLVADALPALLAYVDADERFRFNNKAYKQWMGLEDSQIWGRRLQDVLGESAYEAIWPHVREVLAGREVSYETTVRYANGREVEIAATYVPHIVRGKVQGFVALVNDVSERRRMERELAGSEQRYRTFVRQSTEGIWRFELRQPIPVDLPEERQVERMFEHAYLAECNDAMARMYGYESARDLIGMSLKELMLAGVEQNTSMLRAFVRSGYRLTDAESHERDREGNPRFFLNNFTGVIENNHLVRAWGTQRDITERKLAEELKTRLLESERSARAESDRASRQKDEFLASLSHELRTPLTPVLLSLSMLMRRDDLPPEVSDALSMARQNVELEARLIDDLLDLTRVANGKLQLFPEVSDVHQLLRRAMEICCGGAGAAIELRLDASRHHAWVDPGRLQQVFWNLLSNARKYTPPDGRIAVCSRNDEAGRVRIEVADTGEGIAPETLPRIFNAFEQGDAPAGRRRGGMGLGLAIARAITEAHGGSITASSAGRGMGAKFTLELSTMDPQLTQFDARKPAPASRRSRSLRILLVEDHDATRVVMTRLLKHLGHHVTTAGTVEEAIAYADAAEIDLVISDLGLPDGSGHQVMQAFGQAGVKGIAVSGYGMERDILMSRAAGFAEHLIKPVDLGKLEEAIARVE
jgi:PAS domain S-box-containing protein